MAILTIYSHLAIRPRVCAFLTDFMAEKLLFCDFPNVIFFLLRSHLRLGVRPVFCNSDSRMAQSYIVPTSNASVDFLGGIYGDRVEDRKEEGRSWLASQFTWPLTCWLLAAWLCEDYFLSSGYPSDNCLHFWGLIYRPMPANLDKLVQHAEAVVDDLNNNKQPMVVRAI